MRPFIKKRTAIHEAGHFIVGCWAGLPVPESMELTSNDGRVVRKPTWLDRFLRCEQRGIPFEAVSPTAAVDRAAFDDQCARYREIRATFIDASVFTALAGASADTELSTGDGTMGQTDYFAARDAGLLVVSKEQLPKFLEERMNFVRNLCRTKLRQAILASAEALLKHRHLDQPALERLWFEFNPENEPAAA
jgi:hypothetical protein